MHRLVVAQGRNNRGHSGAHRGRSGARSAVVDTAGTTREEPLVRGFVDEEHVGLRILAEPRAALRLGGRSGLQRREAEIAPTPDHDCPESEIPQRQEQDHQQALRRGHAPPAHVHGRRAAREEGLELLQHLWASKGVRGRGLLLLLLLVDPEACELPVLGDDLVLVRQGVDDELRRPEQAVLGVVERTELSLGEIHHRGLAGHGLHDQAVEGTQRVVVEGVLAPGGKVELQPQVGKDGADAVEPPDEQAHVDHEMVVDEKVWLPGGHGLAHDLDGPRHLVPEPREVHDVPAVLGVDAQVPQEAEELAPAHLGLPHGLLGLSRRRQALRRGLAGRALPVRCAGLPGLPGLLGPGRRRLQPGLRAVAPAPAGRGEAQARGPAEGAELRWAEDPHVVARRLQGHAQDHEGLQVPPRADREDPDLPRRARRVVRRAHEELALGGPRGDPAGLGPAAGHEVVVQPRALQLQFLHEAPGPQRVLFLHGLQRGPRAHHAAARLLGHAPERQARGLLWVPDDGRQLRLLQHETHEAPDELVLVLGLGGQRPVTVRVREDLGLLEELHHVLGDDWLAQGIDLLACQRLLEALVVLLLLAAHDERRHR
mmetsp:Transcript_48306/g.154265  ORF Transcript_48306/g.154265 Transcript_48306/m.154265 type:complete len:598 (+) Transcript_48306:1457-3250(+)